MVIKTVFVLVFFCAFINISSASNSWCSKNKCLCKKFTNNATNLPSSIAECNGLSMNEFPDFSKLPKDLTNLDLSWNIIEHLKSANNAASDILKKLKLSHNGISDIRNDFFQNFSALSYLDLSHNNFSDLPEGVFVKQKHLVHLDLSYNNLKDLPSALFDSMPLLRVLDLSYNPLGNFLTGSKAVLSQTLGVSPNITHLNLNNADLIDLHPDYFEQFQTLKHVELQDNGFQYIPNVPYSVEYLDLSGNNLTFVSARYLNYYSLKVLRLSRMPSLLSIHHYAFYNLQSLETLIITDCPNVREFTELAFGLASKTMNIHPKNLILARNGITSLSSKYAHMFRNMKHIDLRHNPWDCNCEILWLQEFTAELFKGQEIRCTSPRILQRKRLLELHHQDLQDCFPEIYGKASHRILIVVLMASVLFLMGLIFYLIRYPTFWIGQRHLRGIGPSSPYSISPQDDARHP